MIIDLRRTQTPHRVSLPTPILNYFYKSIIESIRTCSITVWYGNSSISDWKALQWVVKTAQSITGSSFPAIKDIYNKWCKRKACSIKKDPSHPPHGLVTPLPSGRRLQNIRANRLMNRFFLQAVRKLNRST